MPTGETKKSFFGLIEDTVTKTEYVDEFTGYSDKEIDGIKLSNDSSDALTF